MQQRIQDNQKNKTDMSNQNKVHLQYGQILPVVTHTMDNGFTGVEYVGAKTVQYLGVAERNAKHGAILKVAYNGKVMELNQRFFQLA